MKTLHINSSSIVKTFGQLKEQLSASYKKCFKEHCLTFDNEIGYGEVRGVLLKNNISYLEFNVTFNEDIDLNINTNISKAVNIAYCSKGKIAHQFTKKNKKTTLEPFQIGFMSNITSSKNTIYFKKETNVIVTLITAYELTASVKKNTVHQELFETFVKNKKENNVFISSHNLKIAEKIEQVTKIKEDGVMRSLLIEGIVHMVLALEIQQYKRDLKNSKQPTGSLTLREMQEIKEISTYIKNYPERATTIEDLCKKTGVTSSKLQEGFKLMHNTTVNDFIRTERVKKSEELIKNSDLNISQIVYSVGFSSRSYFCKIFKQKYNCTPTEYKSRIKLAATA
ncbi:transcriptional regulator, AraC family [Tenacibaculum mesophilum]|uniref:AraC family transcriptional regulator n=1 Tax=Tenacibaculum mesophilum TaxID=104268 RepID=A0ABN5T1S9_9FLAO|nr:AraC family transcriptional regulator [Tenacibaculum mesophilum]AZJ31245.1 AraC family transcriptional regulator [Tenacibaculum mesophilum]QFS29292.1 helix-turn-helix domain-containing protein [Tenacibaculum mesophilum]SHF49296.1 transcriptional regulator, AraC family [Tenacibaculum mesophilum]